MYWLPLFFAVLYMASYPIFCPAHELSIKSITWLLVAKMAYASVFICHEAYWILNGFWDDYELSSVVYWQIISSSPFIIMTIQNYLEYRVWLNKTLRIG